MKRIIFLAIFTAVSLPVFLQAQDSPGEYMTKLSAYCDPINKNSWDYIRQASKGRNAGRIEKRRLELAKTLREAKTQTARLPGYKGDPSLRNAISEYLNLSYLVINNDFQKIVDMEKIAEDSYDLMEAYLLTKERVNERMDSAFAILKAAESEFASHYSIRLIENDSRVSRKLDNAGEVNKYYNQVYLIFFKSYWYESQLINAIGSGKVGDMEQFRQSLELQAKEGLTALKTITPYKGNSLVKDACRELLEFYISETSSHIPKQIEFFDLSDRMNTAAKNYKEKGPQNQQDVDQYNSLVQKYNTDIASYNKTNNYLNTTRNKGLDKLNKATDAFFDAFL